MPINTKIEGDPESIYSAARWLRSTLSLGVRDTVTQIYRARSNSEADWTGDAGSNFRARTTSGGKKADELAADADSAGQSFEVYADDLVTAKAGMARAIEVATAGGLEIDGDTILDPGPAPTAPQALPTDGSVTPQMVQNYEDGVRAQQAYSVKTEAYAAASEEAVRARQIVAGAKNVATGFWKEVTGKAPFHAADLTNGVVGGLAARHSSVMLAEQRRLLGDAERARQRYLRSPGGSPEARFQTDLETEARKAAHSAGTKAGGLARRIASKVPGVGLGISAAGIGYDIHQGKPAGKAIISGLGGAAAGIAVGALASGPVGWVALGAVAAGIGTAILLDAGYDALPQGVKDGIENGVKATGEAIGDAGKSVGNAAKDVWNSVF